MKSKFIALDIGNVCIELNDPMEILLNAGVPIHKLPALKQIAMNFELGITDEKTFLCEAESCLANKFTKEQIYTAFRSILRNEMPGMAELMKLLVHKGYAIAFFSDTSTLHLRESCCMLSFSHLIIGGAYSFETGTLKPDEKMLSLFESRYGKPALYIDDKENNIKGAIAYGWTGSHRFTSVDKLRPVIETL